MKASTEQAKAIKDRIPPMLAYLHRLKARIDFLHNDPLYALVTDARESLHSLLVELSCGHGVPVDMPTLETWIVEGQHSDLRVANWGSQEWQRFARVFGMRTDARQANSH